MLSKAYFSYEFNTAIPPQAENLLTEGEISNLSRRSLNAEKYEFDKAQAIKLQEQMWKADYQMRTNV